MNPNQGQAVCPSRVRRLLLTPHRLRTRLASSHAELPSPPTSTSSEPVPGATYDLIGSNRLKGALVI